jgi:hypothetical protein
VKFLASLLASLLFVLVVSTPGLLGQRISGSGMSHTQWVAGALKEIKSIKVGMTRKDLTLLFTVEGGIHNRSSRTYVYRECPYIKIDVEFRAVRQTSEKLKEFPDDEIVRISKAYLDYSVVD